MLMKTSSSSLLQHASARVLALTVAFFPMLVQAHPGHYHPEETDEFDFFKATFFHSHGMVDYLVAAVFLLSIACLIFSGKRSVKLASLATAIGSLVVLPLL